jgi:hypothetical protein
MFWKAVGSGDERTVVLDSCNGMLKLLGPFQEEKDATEWLEDNGFEEGPGFYVSIEGDRPGDIEEGIWWRIKKKKVAAEIREMTEPVRL